MAHLGGASIIGCQSQKHPSHGRAHCDFLSYQGKYERESSVLILSGGPGPFNPCSAGDEVGEVGPSSAPGYRGTRCELLAMLTFPSM